MIYPTLRIEVHRMAGTDRNGQPLMVRQPDQLVCPVRLNFTVQHTTVRTDSSGTHGQAYEETADVSVLARPEANIELDDMLVIMGHKVRVASKHPRFEVTGRLDHIQLKCIAWK